MDKVKKEKLESMGWKIGTADEFLGLTPEESAYLDMKMALSKSLKVCRIEKRMTQVKLARMIQSSQSRVAKMEACDPTVSLDLLIKSHLALGTTREELANILKSGRVLEFA
ncbi:MAG: helix-turn-helix transcriptional regulator [Anaerolineae bacterium]|jgi:DNA-binding XRE family transcriptional regulator|nr:helix-turn-helix transcriptional regulator [Anaerolineae bacterium]